MSTARAIGRIGARCSKSIRRQRDRRARRSTMPSACGARWRGSAWACTAGTVSRRATTSTSMPRSRHTSKLMAGSVPDEAVYLDSLRRRRDSVGASAAGHLGFDAEAGTLGRTVHEQQRTAVANLTVALHDLGDRVALYAYYSQGRSAVSMVPVKRFDDHLDSQVIRRLNSLEPGAYSRLGAAIRHGSAVLEARGGTSRRLLVVLSDGLAYDHGYERRLRGRRCAPRADRGAPPRHRLCLSDGGGGHRRRIAAQSIRQHRARQHRPSRSTHECCWATVPFGDSLGRGEEAGLMTDRRPDAFLKLTSVPFTLHSPQRSGRRKGSNGQRAHARSPERRVVRDGTRRGPTTRQSATRKPFSRPPTARACRSC